MHVLLFILAIFLFIGLVLIHEWGHFFIARRNGVEAEEFGLGFPPRAIAKKLTSGLTLSLNWLPIGGFVKLKGEHDSDDRPGSYGAASLGGKTQILLAGVVMNLVAAWFLLTIIAWLGMPVLIDKESNGQDQFTVKRDTHIISQQVEAGDVLPGSPAANAGLHSLDIIISIASGQDVKDIKTPQQLKAATSHFAGQTVAVTYKHDGTEQTKGIRLLTTQEVAASLNTDQPKGNLGVVPVQLAIQRSSWSAPITAIGLMGQFTELSAKALWHAVAGLGSATAGLVTSNHAARENGQTQASGQVGGPVAIAKILWSSGSLGINFVLVLIALISLSLALVNLLPLPVMDGGRLYMTLIARGIFKRPISFKAEEAIIGAGWIILMALVVLVVISDVNRFY